MAEEQVDRAHAKIKKQAHGRAEESVGLGLP